MQTVTTTSEAAIWARIIEPEKNGLSPAAARALLKLRFREQDLARMNELARKNQQGLLSDTERQDLENYVKVGDVLSLLHLKARKSIPHGKPPRGPKDGRDHQGGNPRARRRTLRILPSP